MISGTASHEAATKRRRDDRRHPFLPKATKDAEHDDVDFVQADRRIGSAVIQDDEVQHGSGGKAAGLRRPSMVFEVIADEMQRKQRHECKVV